MAGLNSGDLFKKESGTVHINARADQIAKIVIMAGDPLRAKHTAHSHLKDVQEVSTIRNMLAFTGTYKDVKITVMGHGMGMPSIGIYSYEIMKFYDVDIVIRFGTCGALINELNVGDVVIAQGACTNSRYSHQYELPGTYSAIADFDLVKNAVDIAKEKGIPYKVGNILSSDLFYDASNSALKWGDKMGVLATEMEAYALYCNAAYTRKRALTLLTVSDHLKDGSRGFQTPEERQKKTQLMAVIALEAAIKTWKR